MAPVLSGYLAHAPVLRWNLFPRLATPIDRGATFQGRRVFGDNKTWRGALVMAVGVALAALVACAWPRTAAHLPAELRAHPLCYAALLGAGFSSGELPNSFLKRQLGIAPGARRSSALGVALILFDQADFVPVVWLHLAPLWCMSALDLAVAFGTALAAHLLINVIGYALGARRTLL